MNRKPAKIGKKAANQQLAKPASWQTKEVSTHEPEASFSKVADKIFSERKELLRKLAQ